MPRHLAIIPAYNEQGAIGATVADVFEHAPDFDVLVVDDGSTDATARNARAAGAKVLMLPFNVGIGGAVQSGYKYALENDYDVAVQVDGDGQHDARNIYDLLAHLQAHPDLGLVTGSRFLSGDEKLGYRSSASRRLGIRVFAWVLSRIVGRRVTDPTSGFRMVRGRGIALFARDYPHDYPEVEAVLLLHFHKLQGAEIPVRMRPRTTGVSSINASRSVYYMIKVLLAIFVGLLRARPVVEAGDSLPGHRAADALMDNRIQIVAIFATALQFVVVFELIRQRRLLERYALLWLLSAAVMLGLSIWRGALEELASLIGVAYAPSALFVIAFGFVLLMLLHFSLVISKLADENKVLAQRLGLLQQRVDEVTERETDDEYAAPGPRA